jgi:hypothetical protein
MALLKMMTGARRRRLALGCWAACLIGMVSLGGAAPENTAPARARPSAEYQLKAVFLFNFAQFVEWPARAFPDAGAPLVIGILGEDPFGAYLDELVNGEKVGNRPLAVRRYKRVEDVTDCHILFISGSEAGVIDRIVTTLKGRSLLTVSDVELFTRRGGMVRFVTEDRKIRLRINLEAAAASELTISSKILRASTIVTAGKD